MKGIVTALLFVTTLISFNKAYATHAMGGEIWYECNGGTSYTVYFAFYRDCNGINAPGSLTINYSSSCTGTNSLTLSQVAGTGTDITPTCPGQNSSCSGGSFPGVQRFVYSATVNLTPCADWVFYDRICCRNNAITNINNPGGEGMYIEATLDNLNNPCNSSPYFTNAPVPYVCVGQTFCFNHGAIDPDGDSLAWQMITPYDNNNTDPVNYNGGFSSAQPVTSNPAISFDPQTGDICMTPANVEVSVTAVVIEHWSNGQLVGTVMRDMQIKTMNCTNDIPSIDGVNSTNVFSVSGCEGNTIAFTTNGTDPNGGNLTMSWNGGITGATFNIANNGTTAPVGSFSWTPGPADVSATPHCFTVTIMDDACPINGFQTYSFCITVGSGNIVVTSTDTDPQCNGVCDGQIVIGATGGTGPYTYSLDGVNFVSGNTFASLCDGTYDVYAMDVNNCSNAIQTTLIDPAALAISTSSSNVSCNGGNNGLAGVTATGGTPGYTYSWTNGSTNQNIFSLTAGQYDITVTDDNSCTQTTTVNITEPSALTGNAAVTDATCAGNDGQIAISPIGGTPPYTYSWSHNGALSGSSATGLAAGNYSITITDDNSCTYLVNATVAINGTADASFTYNGNKCLTGNSYQFTNQGTSGVGVTHIWDFGDASSNSNAENPTHVYTASGSFDVEHIVVNGACSDTSVVTIQVYPQPTSSVSGVNPDCNGAATGTVDLTVNGGTPNYGYLWSNGSITEDLNNLVDGIYSVTVTDNNGCQTTSSITLTDPAQLLVGVVGTDAVCEGVCSGTATATASGGTAPYSYLWNDPSAQTTSVALNLCDNSYTVTVTDNQGCTVGGNVLINNATVVSVTTNVTNSNCGQSDGSIQANPTGGTGPYLYTWTPGGQNTQIAINLPAGNYDADVVDQNGCSATTSAIISDNASPTANISTSSNVTCNGGNDGQATVNATGGAGGYSYDWQPLGGNAATGVGLTAGNYTVTVTDGVGCSTSAGVTINEPTPISTTTSSTDANCGQSDGSISVVANGGTVVTDYQYEWTDGANVVGTTATINNVSAGTYYITITDDNSCTHLDSAVVQDLPAGTVTVTASDATCFGACNGSVIASVAGGTAPFSYQWDDGNNSTGISVGNLCVGTYTVTVTDAVGCVITDSDVIGEPTQLTASIQSETDVTCFGDTDGSAQVLASGGTAPYNYQWDANAGNQTGTIATGLAPGGYVVVVTDDQNCTFNTSVNIGEPVDIVLTGQGTNAHCSLNDGQAEVNVVSGGVLPFTYSWTGSPSTSSIAAGVGQGSYTCTVTDNDGCHRVISITVGDIPAGVATITNTTNPTCNNVCDGEALVSMSGTGTAPYSYSWNNATNATTVGVNNLCGGVNYTATVTDANGCISNASVTLTDPPSLFLFLTPVDALCNGECNGEIQSSVTGGTPPYSYQWDDPSQQTTSNAFNLCANIQYTLIVTDANGCQTSKNASFAEPAPLVLDSTVTNSHCGQSDGAACVNVSGGTPGYNMVWQFNGDVNPCQNNLPAGAYIVDVNDANDCQEQITVIVTDIAGPTASILNVDNVSCANGNDGQATAQINGGTQPYSYLWDVNAGAQITPTASNLISGTYTLTIADDAGCTASTSATITEPQPLNIVGTVNDPRCYYYSDGSVDLVLFGGTPPLSYSWSHNPGLNNASATNLTAGSYVATVTDANGCIVNDNFVLNNPVPVSGNVVTTDVSCNGNCDGIAITTPTAGVAPFTYSWNDVNQQTTPTANGLCANNYSVIITDNNGCLDTIQTVINEPTVLSSSISISGDVTCNGLCNGYAQVDVVGGTMPYTYLWSNGSTNQMATNLCAGVYTVTITDANGCTSQAMVTITEPVALSGAMITSDVTCFNACDGVAEYVVSGGIQPYAYQWNDIYLQNTAQADSLCTGVYNVSVLDANGCSLSANVNIAQPVILDVNITTTDANCGQNNGQACASVIGGTSPYSYQWNDGNNQTTACAVGLVGNTYTVVVTDANNCSITELVNVNDVVGPVVSLVSFTDVQCAGNSDANIEMNVAGGIMPFQSFQWVDNGTGNTIGLPNSLTLNNVPVGCYTLEVVDDAGCYASQTHCVTQPNSVNSVISASTNPACFEDCNGTATVLYVGGTAPYNVAWSDGQTTDIATDLCDGTHQVTVTDANGCSSQSDVTLQEPTPVIASLISSTLTSCVGSCDGSLEVGASGGTAPYNYSWAPVQGSSSLLGGLCAGNYILLVTDMNGCDTVTDYTVSSPPPLTATISYHETTCGFCNGDVTITPAGGTPPYTYLWQDAQTTQTAVGVCAGPFAGSVIDANGCQFFVDTVVTDAPGPQITSVTTADALCFGSATGSATVNATGGTAPLTYLWQNAQTNPTATLLTAGNYCVDVTDANGCVVTACESVSEPTLLEGIPDGNDTICYGDSTQIWASGSGGVAPYTINWIAPNNNLTGQGPIFVDPLNSQDYCFEVTDASGCVATVECVNITVTPQLGVVIPDLITICDLDSINLTAIPSGGNGDPYLYNWFELDTLSPTGDTLNQVTYTPSGATSYIVTLNDGCSIEAMDTTEILVNPLPELTLNVLENQGCVPFEAEFEVSSDLTGTYHWDFECDSITDLSSTDTLVNFTYLDSGVYDVCVQFVSDSGCVSTITEPSFITVNPLPVAEFIYSPQSTTTLAPFVVVTDQSIGATNWEWDFDADEIIDGYGQQLQHHYQNAGIYRIILKATDDIGCSDTISHTIEITEGEALYLPNTFTPNGDGVNDYFFADGTNLNFEHYSLVIFNRWGEFIWGGYSSDAKWDGTTYGAPAPIGEYVWKLTTRREGGVEDYRIGHVNLLR